jgi:hypothetical protein|tara:strand:+ start:3295 stop:4719 length:1425 start_codon:yes stop_codon:yes gene_type:complete
MNYNVIIPCSGPGSRSSSYSKFHKTLIRIADKAVINHIIDSYPSAKTIYIMLGYNEHYLRQYIEHCGYNNIKYINVENWEESQFASLRQIPREVFDEPFYLNSCDNWSTLVPLATENTAYFCKPHNLDYYDTVDNRAFAGIGYVKDGVAFYDSLHRLTASRNDYLIYNELANLEHADLTDWFDVGNSESYAITARLFSDNFSLLDKTHQEIYRVNNNIIKLFKKNTNNLVIPLTTSQAYPHPQPIKFTDNAISYTFIEGITNVEGAEFDRVFDNLKLLWQFCINNNKNINSKNMWQEKTFERFDQLTAHYPEFTKTIYINGQLVDPIRVLEYAKWADINTGIYGPCHGDLNLDNIILTTDVIHYIDHREGQVLDIFYDICKFYHSLHLNNKNLKNFSIEYNNTNAYTISIDFPSADQTKIDKFRNTDLYKKYKDKIELGVGCIWLSMAPLNVDDQLNKFLFLYAIKHLKELSSE